MIKYVIAFFGPDGSGKSTQAELLAKHLQSNGFKVKKVWMRSSHTLAYLMQYFLVKVGFYRVVSNPFGMKKKLPAVSTSHAMRTFWSLVELLSIIPIIILRVSVPFALGYTLIAERCTVDTIVNIAYLINDDNFPQSLLAKILLNLIPRKTIYIHLDSDYQTLLKRRGKNVEAYSLIRFQRNCYETMGKLLGATYINTSNCDVNQTSNIIKKLVESRTYQDGPYVQKCIITFMGPVGVGKSTQIRLLQKYLSLNKNKVLTTFVKSTHLVSYQLSNLLRKTQSNVRTRLFSLIYCLDILSISVKFFFRVYVPFHLGFTVIIEEGPVMTLFTYAMRHPKLMGVKPKNPSFISSLISWISKQKHVNVILDADYNELAKRRKSRNYRRYELPQYVILQKKWLSQINNHLSNTILINTTKLSAIQTHQLIIKEIEKRKLFSGSYRGNVHE